jgi:hypothetical protein
VFNRFRIYRETLSRFSCTLHAARLNSFWIHSALLTHAGHYESIDQDKGNSRHGGNWGSTGFKVATQLGIGDVADRQIPLETCVATVRRALDAGLNLIDTAPMYEDGYSEEIVGEAIRSWSGQREELFVIDKIDDLEAPVAPQIARLPEPTCSSTRPMPSSSTPLNSCDDL